MYKASALRAGSCRSDISSSKGHNPFKIRGWGLTFCIKMLKHQLELRKRNNKQLASNEIPIQGC